MSCLLKTCQVFDPATAEKLKESGFDTLLSLAVASPGELVELVEFIEGTCS